MEINEILLFFANYIERELGIVYAEHNYFQLQNRLEDIAKNLGFENLQMLAESAQKSISGPFKQLLLDVATNNETSFFRDPKVFKAIENRVFPELTEDNAFSKIKIWSAANSTGQEALSLAMLMLENKAKLNKTYNFSILGTDISERALTKSRSGLYSQLEVQRGLSTPLMLKYFTKNESDQWLASSELLKHISYKTMNLKEPFNFSEKFDLVLCRNVLIYQSVEGKIAILRKITENLSPKGFLVLGSGESLMGLSTDYEQCLVDGAVVYRKRA